MNQLRGERERNATIIEIHTIRGKGHNRPYIFITCKLFTTFGSSEFLDTGPNRVLCGAAGALNHSPGKIHMEQGCHLAAALQKDVLHLLSQILRSGRGSDKRLNFHYY